METLKRCRSLHGYIIIVVFVFLAAFSTGSTCEAPSSPQCFRRTAEETIYICEWSTNSTENNVTYDLHIDEKLFGSIEKTSHEIEDEQLIKYRPVNIWVEAHVGNSSCTSSRRSVVLKHTVKYEAPENINMSWLKDTLSLSWTAPEEHPASAEVQFRQDPTESWREIMINTTHEPLKYQVILVNLSKHSAYQVQIRQRSTQAQNPLWSGWSPVVKVPAELQQKPQVSMATRLVNGTREVTLTWKRMPRAAAVSGLTYTDTQTSLGCPCVKRRNHSSLHKLTAYVSYSAVNISVVARNAAGYSPPSVLQVPAEPAAGLQPCTETLLDSKLDKKTCLELYELRGGVSRPENVITLTPRKKKNERARLRKTVKDFTRYLYFEHRCDDDGKPRTVKMCLFHQTQGVPPEPQSLSVSGETHNSAHFSWTYPDDQQAFLTHFSFCSRKISSQNEPEECYNISASEKKYHLKNLTPGQKYNISLAGLTQAKEGQRASLIINTLQEKPVNVLLWSLCLLFVVIFISAVCTILIRIKKKIIPPVPTPVIPNSVCYLPESEDMLQKKEEVHKLTLHWLLPEGKSVLEGAEETTVVGGEWDDGSDEDVENDESGDSRMSGGTSDEGSGSADPAQRSSGDGTDLEQVEKEITMLIYRNGLVFDVKTDSP